MITELAIAMVSVPAVLDMTDQAAIFVLLTILRTQTAPVCFHQIFIENNLIIPFLLDCEASTTCHGHGACDSVNGLCACEPTFSASTNCSSCEPDHYNYPGCSCM